MHLYSHVKKSNLPLQIKVFARTGCVVGKEKQPVFTVVLEDLGSSLTYSCGEIKSLCEKSGFGLISSNDFLKADSEQTEIIRKKQTGKEGAWQFMKTA